MNSDIKANVKPPDVLVLPDFIYSKEQVNNLITEILHIEDFLYRARVRQSGTKLALPSTTQDLDKFASANKRNILNHAHRVELAKFLREVANRAPLVTIYFSVGQDKRFIEGLINWFRTQVHTQVLFQLNPHAKIGGGCVVRIKHKTYDFSLKKRFDEKLPVLQQSLSA